MNSRRRARNIAWRLCAAGLLCAAASVSAQTIYRQVDVAGSIMYTDRPDTTSSPQTATAPESDVPKEPARISTISPRRAALINASEAARRLEQAQKKRKQGMAPLPGERAQGTQAGAVNHRYWRRQEKLRDLVEQAQRRSIETRETQLAAR